MQPLRRLRCRFLAFRRPAAALSTLALALSLAAPAAGAPASADAPAAAAEQADQKSAGARRVARRSARSEGAEARGAGRTGAAAKEPHKKRAATTADARRGEEARAAATPEKRKPLSIGAPNKGRLQDAARLRSSRHLKVREGARAWGLPVLVKALRRAAFQVAKRHGDSALLVGDLSAKNGGRLDGHNSHQTGRDADVGFYVVNSKGKSIRVERFVPFDAKGNAIGMPGARFDDKRNWALVEALLQDKKAEVKYLFVTDPLRARLLAYAAKRRVPEALRARAAAAMMSPQDADLHNDHFHVRIACPTSMRGTCVEESTARDSAPDATRPLEAASDPPGAAPDEADEDDAEPAYPDDDGEPPQAKKRAPAQRDAGPSSRPRNAAP